MTPTEDIKQPNEAGFSTNLYLNHPKMGRTQFTFRGATSTDWGIVLEDVDKFLHYMRDKGWKFDGEQTVPTSAPQNTEPVRVPIDESGKPLPEIKILTAERLTVDLHDNKLSVHVIGKPWTKYGVPLYVEAWEAAGLKIIAGEPVPNVAGWQVEYVCKDDGKPQKVTRLLPPK